MAYRIEYSESREKRRNTGRGRIYLTLFWMGVFLILVCTFWPDGRQLLRRVLIPGDPEHTLHAAAKMLGQLRDGADMGDAVTAFYRTVTEYGAGY